MKRTRSILSVIALLSTMFSCMIVPASAQDTPQVVDSAQVTFTLSSIDKQPMR